MNMKRVLRSALALALIALLAVSMFACSKEKEEEDTTIFDNQIVNNRYYFQQGYPDDWAYTQGEDGLELRELDVTSSKSAGWLCTKIYPKSGDDQVYMIYKYDSGSDLTTRNDFVKDIKNVSGNSLHAFNDIFYEESGLPRDTFVLASTEDKTTTFNQIQWDYADYTFVKDGEDWKGTFYVTVSGQAGEFMVVTCEAKATVWDTAKANFDQMMEDFAFVDMGASTKK